MASASPSYIVNIATDVGNGKINTGINFYSRPISTRQVLVAAEELYTAELRDFNLKKYGGDRNAAANTVRFTCVLALVMADPNAPTRASSITTTATDSSSVGGGRSGEKWQEFTDPAQLYPNCQLYVFDTNSPAPERGIIPRAQLVVDADRIPSVAVSTLSPQPTLGPRYPSSRAQTNGGGDVQAAGLGREHSIVASVASTGLSYGGGGGLSGREQLYGGSGTQPYDGRPAVIADERRRGNPPISYNPTNRPSHFVEGGSAASGINNSNVAGGSPQPKGPHANATSSSSFTAGPFRHHHNNDAAMGGVAPGDPVRHLRGNATPPPPSWTGGRPTTAPPPPSNQFHPAEPQQQLLPPPPPAAADRSASRQYLFRQLLGRCVANGQSNPPMNDSISTHTLHGVLVQNEMFFSTEVFSEMTGGRLFLSEGDWAALSLDFAPVLDVLYDRIAAKTQQRTASGEEEDRRRAAERMRDRMDELAEEEARLMARQAVIREEMARMRRDLQRHEQQEKVDKDEKAKEWDVLTKFVGLKLRQHKLKREELQINHQLALL